MAIRVCSLIRGWIGCSRCCHVVTIDCAVLDLYASPFDIGDGFEFRSDF